MKNIFRFICLFLFILLMVLPAHAAVATENTTDFQGGKGTQAEPYLVSTAAQLDNVRKYPDAHFKQVATIYLDDYSNWTPIGSETTPFTGTYDGNGYSIYGLTITRTGSASVYLGLFGYSKGYISGVKLQNVSITGTFTYGTGCNMGAVAGYSSHEIVGCSVSGTIQCTLPYNGANVGGIAGYCPSKISYCNNSADITVTTSATSPSNNHVSVGGIVGTGYDDFLYCTNSGDIYSNCSNTEMGGIAGSAWDAVGCSNSGAVTLDTFSTRPSATAGMNWNHVGGVFGYVISSAKECANSGAVIASGYEVHAGGIAGYFEGGSNIDQCRVSGSVSTTAESGSANTVYGYIGGVVGLAQDGNITNCYAVGTVKLSNNATGYCHNGGIVGQVESDTSIIDSCYSLVSSISANTGASSWTRAALVGLNWGTVSNCYWASYSWGIGTNYGTNGAERIYTLSYLSNKGIYEGFDFTNTWTMGTGTYTYAVLKMESGHTHSLSYTVENYSCANGGNLAHWYCSGCDTYFRGQGTKPVAERMVKVYAGDHTYDFDKDPTGTYGGHTAFACIDCGTALAPDGQCGSSVWYNQIGDALYIYGSGSMYNYSGYSCYSSNGDTPWKDEAITFVDIKKGVTTVGQSAFYYGTNSYSNDYLTTVKLPDGLLTIDKSAFAYCTALKTINIPDSVSLLAMYAFRDCSSLETLSMNVDTVDSYCFEFCTSLKELTFGPNLYTIANTVFDKGSTNDETLKITFLGDAPYFDSITFNRQTVEAHYPLCNTTWTDSVKQDYSGTVTWVADGSHTPGAPVLTPQTPASCTTDGSAEETVSCTVCGALISSQNVPLPALGHSFTTYVSDNNATCTNDGTKTAKCDRCDATDTQTDADSKLGHSFTNYISNNDATYDSNGTKTAKCDRCDETDTVTDEGSKLIRNGWFQIDGKWYYYRNDARVSGWLQESNKWYYFDSSGAMVTGVVIIDGTHHKFSQAGAWLGSDHSFTNYVSDGNAACEADGTKTARCDYDNCVVTDTVTDEGSRLGHSFTTYISDDNATCTEDGTKTAKCDRCDKTDTQTDADSKLGHDMGAWETTKEPTCTEIGTERTDCFRCDHFETRDVAATSHSYSSEVTAPTCTEKGFTTYTCSKCSDSYTADEVNALSHDMGAWEVINAPTCTETGTQRTDCSRCDHFETRDVAATSHSYSSEVTAPTCTEKGFTTYTCSKCSDSHTADEVNALSHDMGAWEVINAPTCTEIGSERTDCSRCDHFETRDVAATGHSYGSLVAVGPGESTQECHCGDSITQYQAGWSLWQNDWYFRNADHTLATGWLQNGSLWYYMDHNGIMQTGWLQQGNTWYYLKPDGSMATGWCKVSNTYYYFIPSGAMLTGWLQSGNTWYYMAPSGAMVTGWYKINGTYYYFNASGAMLTGWLQDSGSWYYLNTSGAMVTGWRQISGTWYYFKSAGDMATGWLQLGSTWYYFHSSGAMATGTVYIGGTAYRFNSSGAWLG